MLLGDEQHEKQMARRQLIAVALMSGIFLVYMQFFMPPPVQQPPEEAPTETVSQPLGTLPPTTTTTTDTADTPAATSVDAALPEIPQDLASATEYTTLENEYLRLTFTNIGARLRHADVLLGKAHSDAVERLIPEELEALPETDILLPLGLQFSDEMLTNALDQRQWQLANISARSATYTIELPGTARIEKRFELPPKSHVLKMTVAYHSLEDQRRRLGVDEIPAYQIVWAPQVSSGDETRLVQRAFVWHTNDETENFMLKNLEPTLEGKPHEERFNDVEWFGIRSAYYIVAMKPAYEGADARARGNADSYAFSLSAPRFEVEPNAADERSLEIYIGPNTQDDLANSGWEDFATALRFFQYPDLLDKFAKFLLRSMNWIEAKVFASYGVAIILLTLVVRLLMFPLTLKQVRSMKRMQAIAPEIEELRKKYEDDPQKQQEEMMKLWSETGANPLGGCLPMLVQMPIFIALYRMLSSAFELRGAPFLYISDLSEPDQLFRIPGIEIIPFIGDYFQYFNLLPILGAIAMFASMKLTPQAAMSVNPQQKVMMTVMPIMISLMFYNWAAGLNLYVLTSTVLGVAQTHLTRILDKEETAEDLRNKKKKGRRGKRKGRQHWYNAAIAKKRQAEKAQAAQAKSKGKHDGSNESTSNGRESVKRKGKGKSKKGSSN